MKINNLPLRLLVKVVALELEVALLEVLKKCFVDSQAKRFNWDR